jgi:hypothetical protein
MFLIIITPDQFLYFLPTFKDSYSLFQKYIAQFHALVSRALAELHDMLSMLAEIQVIGALNFWIHNPMRVINHSQKGFEVLPVRVATILVVCFCMMLTGDSVM